MPADVGRPPKIKYQRPRGTYDILGNDFFYLDKIQAACQNVARFYGFKRIETPILEETKLFAKGLGTETEVISQQMYLIEGEKSKMLALRPDGTAPVIRAYIENGMEVLPKPVKLWYIGPFFRHERPQSGRYRQFWQFGFETIGRKNAVVDAQTIQLFVNLLRELGVKKTLIQINSIGCSKCRKRYIKNLLEFLRSYRSELCVDCKKRLRTNPLRILDCKKEKCQKIVQEAPQILDGLCKKCSYHFREVLEFLDILGLPYKLNPYLVRGLDYYTRTVFEIFPDIKKKTEIMPCALVGGGRYDNLVELLGGKPTPGCGAAAGVERIIELMKQQGIRSPEADSPKVFLAQLGISAKRRALKLVEEFREANVSIGQGLSRDSLGAQLSKASKMGTKYVLILGQKEVLDKEIILRDMAKQTQKTIKQKDIIKEIKKKIK